MDRMRPPKNSLLNLNQKELLEVLKKPGTYDNDNMMEALYECEGLDELTPEETARRKSFLDLFKTGLEMSWMMAFFEDRGIGPFKTRDVVAWAAQTLEYELDEGETEADFARGMMERFQGIIDRFVEAGHIRKLSGEGQYEIVRSENNPIMPENDEDDTDGDDGDVEDDDTKNETRH